MFHTQNIFHSSNIPSKGHLYQDIMPLILGNWASPVTTCWTFPPHQGRVVCGRRIIFDTAGYMAECKTRFPDFFPAVPFYPQVTVFFEITEAQTREHFHVPLTWNPYGYSTYRGS